MYAQFSVVFKVKCGLEILVIYCLFVIHQHNVLNVYVLIRKIQYMVWNILLML